MDMNIYFKKSLSGIISSALVLGVVGFGSTSAQAADRGVLNINCDAADISSTSYTLSDTQVGDTLRIQNMGTTDDCVIVESNVLGNDAGGVSVSPGITSSDFTVSRSGSFTVQSSAAGNPSTTVLVDACILEGLGTDEDPWKVSNADDLDLVGETGQTSDLTYNYSCTPSGSYLQTANIDNVELAGTQIGEVFTGTYDGDHYNISYFSDEFATSRDPLFDQVGPGGVIRKLSLSGNITTDGTYSSSLVDKLYGGVISEVQSSVLIQVDDDNDAVIGGLVARSGGIDQNGLIAYSKFDGRIEWLESSVGSEQEGPTIGGLVGMARGTGVTEIRDSYSRAAIAFDSLGLTNEDSVTHPDAAVFAGGLVGSDGFTEISESGNFDENPRQHVASSVSLIRSYFAGSFTNLCPSTNASICNIDVPSHVFTGGLIGVSSDLNNAGDIIASAFWLSSSVSNAVGQIVDGGDQPNVYSVEALPESPGSLPEAPGLSTSFLTTLSTYQSEEGEPGEPSGTSDLLVANSSIGDLSEQDYRWAIEAGSVGTFVPSSYSNESEFSSRELFTDTTVPQSYRVRGAGDLLVHGGADSETVTGYPSLGRVWEICTNENNGFPVLVWEERTCSGGGSAAGGNPGGLSDAEYAEFLRSGLTLEQFLARRLAATGAPAEAVGQGLIVAALLAATGLGLILGRRRLRSGKA
jgi:hypothetical protein